MQSFISQTTWQFPELAAPWAVKIADATQRDFSIENVARQWLQVDPKSAEAWLAATPLSDERKQRLLKNKTQ